MKREQNPGLVKGEKAKNLFQHNSSYEELWLKKENPVGFLNTNHSTLFTGFLVSARETFDRHIPWPNAPVREILLFRALSFFGSHNASTFRPALRSPNRPSSLFPDRGRLFFRPGFDGSGGPARLGLGGLRTRQAARSAHAAFDRSVCVGLFLSCPSYDGHPKPHGSAILSVLMRTSSTRRRGVLAPGCRKETLRP